jgi:hypothetical protein
MKNLAPLFIALLFAVQAFSQVGINTTEPTATLDVDGNIRIRKMNSTFTNSVAVTIVGMDEDGNFVLIDVDENIILQDNKLRAVERRYRSADVSIIGDGLNNMDLLILPGEPNDDKKIIRLSTPALLRAPLEITGIVAGDDGQTVWLYIQNDTSIKLMGLNINSDPENQFMIPGQVVLQQYDMIQLMYDANIQKWVVMDY